MRWYALLSMHPLGSYLMTKRSYLSLSEQFLIDRVDKTRFREYVFQCIAFAVTRLDVI